MRTPFEPITTRASHAKNPLTSVQLEKALAIAKDSLGALEYLSERAVAKHQAAGSPPENKAAISQLIDFVQTVKQLNEKKRSPYDGDWEPENERDLFTEVLSDNAIATLVDKFHMTEELITMFFSIEDNSQFLRVYMEDDQVLDEEKTNMFDKVWNAWLIHNKMLCEDGKIYYANDNRESTGKLVPQQILRKELQQLEPYFKSKQLNVRVNEFEEQAPEAAPEV